MELNEIKDYKSPFYLFSKDIQTILPALFRKVEDVSYKRERIFTPDDDFLDLDWSYADSSSKPDLVIISHGLEGDSQRPYVLGMVKALNKAGLDVLAWNYRGCSGELNKQYKFYHSGETEDLSFVVNYAKKRGYNSINLVGFSVGGNITLKFLGEASSLALGIKKAVAISTPCHLKSVAWHLARFRSKIYMSRFIKSLSQKMKAKAEKMPDLISCENLSSIKNFFEFDTLYTAPMNGYKDAEEYWTKNSSLYYLKNIETPTLIISADNDPFLTPECYPYKEAKENSFLQLEVTRGGGHCGFYSPDKDGIYWSEKKVISFFKKEV